MHSLLIIGVGSPFGEDRLGWQAARFLSQQIEKRYPDIHLQCELLDRPGAVLLEYLKPCGGMIMLIDAVDAQSGMTEVSTYTLDELQQQKSLSSHGFGVAETLALGQRLGMLHSDIVVLGISTGADEWQDPLMAQVEDILGRY